MKILLTTFLIIISGLKAVHAVVYFPYRLEKPDARHILPPVLTEISGLTDLDSAHIACVQDEAGTVFIYDFNSGRIESHHAFDKPGDFEGLTRVGKSLYILRSDGRLTEWSDFRNGNKEVRHYQLPLLTNNNEGLCYDEPNNRLLIAGKTKPYEKTEKNMRLIYSFDLKTKSLLSQPVYRLDVAEIGKKAAAQNIHFRSNQKSGKVIYNFRPSSLAVNPLNDLIYIISASDRMLLVMNRKGEFLDFRALEPELFTKPEGITFLEDGTMIITNEAAGKTPSLLIYKKTN